MPASPDFVARLVGDDPEALEQLCRPVLEEGDGRPAREQLAASLAAEGPADPALNIGRDPAASVVAHFCRCRGADTRTSQTMMDVLLLLQPEPTASDLWLCLAALVLRFAPVALLSGTGHAILHLCRLFESLLLFHDPEIALLLKRAGVCAELYCVPWLCTAHAIGLADLSTVLHVWDRWVDGGEPLDPVFLGLARLSLCREELLLCGPVPELAQLLQASLGMKEHAAERVADAALCRAAEMKAVTPLSFLKRLQDALLRPATEEPPVARPESTGAGGYPKAPAQEERGVPKALAQRWGQRASGWLRRDAPAPAPLKAAPAMRPLVEPIACMKVEAQDVMMLETVKERHFDTVQKELERRAAAEAAGEDADAGASPPSSASSALASGSDACRLLPRLIDVRPAGEARRYGIKGVKAVDVLSRGCADEFIEWSTKKKQAFQIYGLVPMHVLLTTNGTMNADQERFLKTVLTTHVSGLCVLSGGYASLEPFFLAAPGGGTAGLGFDAQAAQAAIAVGAQDAKELLQKGVTGLQALWEKAPSRQALKERFGRNERSLGETFERAPLPSVAGAGWPGFAQSASAAEPEPPPGAA